MYPLELRGFDLPIPTEVEEPLVPVNNEQIEEKSPIDTFDLKKVFKYLKDLKDEKSKK